MSPCGCGCLGGVLGLFQTPGRLDDHYRARAEFERTVAFLTSVPLFRKQLPRSELPKVAQGLTRQEWRPGQKLVQQGEMGRAFFLIQSGEAAVLTSPAPGEPERVRAKLCAGDYFGGHTLMAERPNVATIVASGPAPLVTLSMSRTTFEESGLKRWLNFPKRPAIYEGAVKAPFAMPEAEFGFDGSPGARASAPAQQGVKKTAEEEEFIRSAIGRNVNLRALLQASSARLASVAAVAERREVAKGAVVAQYGEVGHEFFVIRRGSFVVDLDEVEERCHDAGQQSAEAAVERSAMADRLMRKQSFLQTLSHARAGTTTVSMALPGRNPEDEAWGLKQKLGEELQRPGRPAKRSLQQVQGEELTPGRPRQATSVALGPGESFGELSLLYNTRREATFRAEEDSIVYVVSRRHFRQCFSRRGGRFQDYLALIEEVNMLSALLSAERWELACSATGLVEFAPGERILVQGELRKERQWYIVYSGTCTTTLERIGEDGQVRRTKLAELARAGTFGERSLLRNEAVEVNVDAGPKGLCCLVFDFEMIRVLVEDALREGDGSMPTIDCEIEEWCALKAHGGWERQTSFPSGLSGSTEGRAVQLGSLQRVCTLGRGAYGTVALVQDSTTGRRYALKTLSKGYIESLGAERLVRWERELLSMVRSPFVIRLHNTYTDEQFIYFLLEAALGGSLLDVIRNHSEVLKEDSPHGSAAAFYVACLTAALEHLHERHIVHRDLKPENVLLDEQGYAKLCDMGFARFVLGKTNTLAGTPEYMAPEMIDFPHEHGVAVDWWALGVVAFELLVGQTPFNDEGISEPMPRLLALRRSQERGPPIFPFGFPSVVRSFVTQLLQKLPQRLGATRGAADVREHLMFRVMKTDFAAIAERRIPGPLVKEEQCINGTDELNRDADGLGLSEKDSLFVRCVSKTSEASDGVKRQSLWWSRAASSF